jgi:hypothetical protein
VRERLAALAAAACLAASCGGPAPAPTVAVPSGAAATPTRAVTPPASIPDGACRLSDPATVSAPASLVQSNGQVAGLTDQGELLVLQSHLPAAGDTVSILDRASGEVTPVVSRPPAASLDDATSQIDASITGNTDWVVWEEGGFNAYQADWHVWAFDRHTGEVREVASFDPDAQHALGSASDVSLLGDPAAWAGTAALGPDTFGSRIYVADLRARTVRRLDYEASYPSLVSASALGAAMRTVVTDPATGDGLAQPVVISLPGGTATPEDWVSPATILAAASSPAGAVVVRLLKNSTADDTTVEADVVARYATGLTRTFALPGRWGPVAAGPGFLRWSDYSHLWIQPSGQPEPTQLLDAGKDAVRFFVSGSYVYWHTDRATAMQYDWTAGRLARVMCP